MTDAIGVQHNGWRQEDPEKTDDGCKWGRVREPGGLKTAGYTHTHTHTPTHTRLTHLLPHARGDVHVEV